VQVIMIMICSIVFSMCISPHDSGSLVRTWLNRRMLKGNSVDGASSVREYKLSQHRIKRNYWSGRIARAIPPCSYYSDYKPLNYDCLCSVHKSTYDIRYGESPTRVATFIFLFVKKRQSPWISVNLCYVFFLHIIYL